MTSKLSTEDLRTEILSRQRAGKTYDDLQFELSLRLVGATQRHLVQEAITLLEDLKHRNGPIRDYLYFLAQAYYAVGNYRRARQELNALLRKEPHNQQARALLDTIAEKEREDGMKGLAVLGSAAVLGVAAGVALFRGLRH
ncbi:hypothetical protein PTSG_06278 [Salpingoeca rosetta]|uniref:Uncharacterized protein n=1 Tax=Salpingoeca rosetta (strain ATCC 50818 / BSB-021) TaxID=946362 RepID=F2UCG2_SALR5|nr:uncharacterized protein PTSG_06278 [Salpingoeca rosetta]EGD74269.1 hypothetical protein PTSG_06278 [Salpingoeca rosetta]|eukprot:XP_004993169.1 hypothetical protein PTSG_06278 [Salpingoeca rosetta]